MKVVTGVHRSGTSLVSLLMEGLGSDFGPDDALYPADEWNPRGYLERRDVMDLNSRLLTGLPRSPGGIRAALSQIRYLTMPSQTAIRRRADKLAGEVEALGQRLDGLTVKDPRFCLTLPVWMDHAQLEACVVCVRHPAEVAGSLQRRQRIPLSVGFRFWDYHVETLLATKLPRLHFVDHAELHGEAAIDELARLAAFLGQEGRTEVELRELYQRVHSPALHHIRGQMWLQELPDRTHWLWTEISRLRAAAATERPASPR